MILEQSWILTELFRSFAPPAPPCFIYILWVASVPLVLLKDTNTNLLRGITRFTLLVHKVAFFFWMMRAVVLTLRSQCILVVGFGRYFLAMGVSLTCAPSLFDSTVMTTSLCPVLALLYRSPDNVPWILPHHLYLYRSYSCGEWRFVPQDSLDNVSNSILLQHPERVILASVQVQLAVILVLEHLLEYTWGA